MAEELAPEELEEGLSGLDKAAIFLLAIGKDNAARVLKHMNPREVQMIGTTMAQLENITREEIKAVFEEFLDEVGEDVLGIDPSEYAQELMAEALGEGGAILDAHMLADQLKGLEALKWMHPSTVANMLRNEHPQVIAVILSYFEPDQAAEVLKGIPQRFHAEVIYRIATLEAVQPNALFDLNDVIENASKDGRGGKLAAIGGTKQAAEIINMLGSTGIEILEEVASEHEDIAQKIQDQLFTFEDIKGLDDRAIQTALAEIPNDVLVLALKAADDELRNKFLNNMSKRQADIMRDDLENAPPAKLSEVEDAQRTIIQVIRRLADEGKITMPGGGEEML
ncbi:flagellar motor switch protein FliG [Sulfurivirga caldicuralii]|uniref:Flagellar motor switch protein FliG n=1 Tax=Sulfurivirga caldicuralii TaxID=364032 RepID=A0A1N6FM55_9GAMM|nr:flagellar motor switch protein FliG [Sulfurivirga caldicuralii]SIN96345.1 flagellar motor switch protein FliG [Sulfurivirga caldicuralii]